MPPPGADGVCPGSISDPIADQHFRRVRRTGLSHRQRPHDLLHEQPLRMRRGSENPHTTGGHVDHEHRVVRDRPLPRPDFGREEVGAGDDVPMRLQKRPPRGRALRDRRQARRLQDPPNRRPAHTMPDIRQRPLDSRVAPCRILNRHPHDELTDLCQNAAPARAFGRTCISGRSAGDTSAARCPARDRGDLPEAARPTRYARAASRRRSSSVRRGRRPPS
jgi:hypothetical protein